MCPRPWLLTCVRVGPGRTHASQPQQANGTDRDRRHGAGSRGDDSATRQLARFAGDVADNDATGMHVRVDEDGKQYGDLPEFCDFR